MLTCRALALALAAGGTPSLGSCFAIEKLFGFLETLSPEQRVAFEDMTSPIAQGGNDSTNLFATPPVAPVAADKFYNLGSSAAAAPEVLVLAVLMALHYGENIRGLQRWVIDAETEMDRAVRMAQHGEVWAPAPPPNNGLWATGGAILGPLDAATGVRMGKSGIVETAANVVSSNGDIPGASTLVTAAAVDWYLIQIRKPRSRARKIQGALRDRSGNASSRHVSAIPAISALLRSHGRRIRHAAVANAIESTDVAIEMSRR